MRKELEKTRISKKKKKGEGKETWVREGNKGTQVRCGAFH